jgi:hypothetical protein
MLCVLIDCVAPDWSDICWATQLFPEIALCARVFDVFRPYDVDDIFFFYWSIDISYSLSGDWRHEKPSVLL